MGFKHRNNNGRPQLPSTEKKSYTLNVKLNPMEHYWLVGKASQVGVTKSEFARQSLNTAIVKERLKPEHAKIIRQLSAMGNNLNQLAKRAHQAGFSQVRFDIEAVVIEMDKLIKAIAYDG